MWLPFSLRCKLRILSIIHKSIYSFAPSYISDLIKKRTILSSLRYQNAPLLISQNSSKTSLNSRAFKNSVEPYGNPSLLPFVLKINKSYFFFSLYPYSLNHPTYYFCPCYIKCISLLNCYCIIIILLLYNTILYQCSL